MRRSSALRCCCSVPRMPIPRAPGPSGPGRAISGGSHSATPPGIKRRHSRRSGGAVPHERLATMRRCGSPPRAGIGRFASISADPILRRHQEQRERNDHKVIESPASSSSVPVEPLAQLVEHLTFSGPPGAHHAPIPGANCYVVAMYFRSLLFHIRVGTRPRLFCRARTARPADFASAVGRLSGGRWASPLFCGAPHAANALTCASRRGQ